MISERRLAIAATIVLASVIVPIVVPHAPAFGEPSSRYVGMRVTVVATGRQCFEDLIPASGVLVAKTEIAVRAARDGLLIGAVLVQPGDTVAAGQTLAKLVAGSGGPSADVSVTAPVAGTVVAVAATVGAYASPVTSAPMFRIVERGELQMKGQILASALPRLKVGQAATLDIMGLQRLDGHVEAIDEAIDPLSQLGTVRIALNPDARLRLGAYARAQVDAGSQCDVAVPLSSILYGQDGAVVQVVVGARVASRRVTVGITAPDGSVQIRDGLQAGDVVIVRAGGFLRDGDPVQPLSQDDPTP